MLSPDKKRGPSDTLVLSTYPSVMGDTTDQSSNHHGDYSTSCHSGNTDHHSNIDTDPSSSVAAELSFDQTRVRNNSCADQEEFGEFCFSPSTTPGVCLSRDDMKELINVDGWSVIAGCENSLRESSLEDSDGSVHGHVGNKLVQTNTITAINMTDCSINTLVATDITECSIRARSECVYLPSTIDCRCDHDVYNSCSKLNGCCVLNRHNIPPSINNGNRNEDKELTITDCNFKLCVENINLVDSTETSSRQRREVQSVTNHCLPIINHCVNSERLIDDYSDDFDDFKTADNNGICETEGSVFSSCSAAGEQGVSDASNWAVFDDQCSATSFDAGLSSEEYEADHYRGESSVMETEDIGVRTFSQDHTSPIAQNVWNADVIVKTIKDSFLQEKDSIMSTVLTPEFPSFTEPIKPMVYHPQLLSSRMSDDVVWNGMNVIENTAALKHHWSGSHTQSLVLRALSVNPSNILTKAKITGATLLSRGK